MDFTTITINWTNISSTSSIHLIIRTDVENIIAAVIVVLLSGISVVGNGLVILSFVVEERLRQQKGNYLVATLAITDLMRAVYVMMPSAITLFHSSWKFGEPFCQFYSFICWTLMTVSNASLGAISVDRALAITQPFAYPNLVTARRIRVVIACIWIKGLALSIVPVVSDWVSYEYSQAMCTVLWSSASLAYAIICSMCTFVIPSILMIVCNIRIALAITRSRSVVFTICNVNNSNGNLSDPGNTCFCKYTTGKSLKSLYILVAVYFLSLLPYSYAKLTNVFGSDVPNIVNLASTLMHFASSAANPLIYGLLRKDFKSAMLKVFKILRSKVQT